MYEYDEEVLRVFLKKQLQLFDEPVAETMEEAEAFLEDCMAAVVDSLDEVIEYFDEIFFILGYTFYLHGFGSN